MKSSVLCMEEFYAGISSGFAVRSECVPTACRLRVRDARWRPTGAS